MFMQNGEYAAFWYLQFLCYFTQLQFTIDQNGLVPYSYAGGAYDKYKTIRFCAWLTIKSRWKHRSLIISPKLSSDEPIHNLDVRLALSAADHFKQQTVL